MKVTKIQKIQSQLVDPEKLYTPIEAIELVKKAAKAKFDETVEMAVDRKSVV